ncbi:glycoside hydrolase family 2 [Bosea sp. Tri-44]|uniref:glycoside hydrolase family 2 protein n=1 Tax=Bosea sp. Tri-44 TaxID=1972137 RepID=UPI00100E78B3|nr:glycoside hydrolase family 2 TIM barrel-domain containing protein [Bosea sp. Tri-44]RXT48139.1 glycoside hydrolase family 2 [Bosea sp. Tri-44]
MAAEDPFQHLHDEDYARPYLAGLVGAEAYVPIHGRPVFSLDGDWRLTLDLFDEGLRQKWFLLDETPPSQWSHPRDYEIEAGELVSVPSCWNVLKPEWTYFEGAAWYTRHVDWQRGPAGERSILNIGAANYSALVFVNGSYVGGHRGGSTPFSLDVTDNLRDGRNRLQIMVENRRSPNRVPMQHIDWFNYGGLYRDISLMRLPAVFIRQAQAMLLPGGREVRFSVVLSDASNTTAQVDIPELGLSLSVPIRNGKGEVTTPFAGQLWSPDAPRLYDVQFSCGADRISERIGFRTIEARGTDILLNGETIRLKGVCVHEDDLALGKVSTEADVRRRFHHVKELGGNFLRLSHYPHHEHVARIADEMGLLLWAEIPVYWAIAFDNPETYADAENQLRELIARDINRASVILWGVGNENADTDARLAFMSRLAQAARRTDPTRLVGAACLINRETFAIEDRLAEHLDVIGLNEYFGWYEPDFSGLDRLLANSNPGKPVIVSETGADALSGHRGAGRVLFTEDWQAEFYRQQVRRLAATPYVAGIAAWLLYDFRTERRQTGFQKGFNRKGLIAEDKTTRKLAFAVLAGLFAEWRT